ncbi:hypothetical protein ABH977_008387 [Bradyrhizobium ottawaense]
MIIKDDQHPIAVVLYFVDPIRPGRDLLGGGGQAELVRHTHATEDKISPRAFQSGTSGNPAD